MIYDAVIVGGGIVGSTVAYGLLKKRLNILVLDGDDTALKASRGNFGLVWQQSKGLDFPKYAELTYTACSHWKEFSGNLFQETGIDPCYQNDGGLVICFDQEELDDRASRYAQLREESPLLDQHFHYDKLDQHQLKEIMPSIGPTIPGGLFSKNDGHCNPLFLLRALHKAIHQMGGDITSNAHVEMITPNGDSFEVRGQDGLNVTASRVVIAAGLGSIKLAPMIGLNAPLKPMRGQLIVTERVPPLIPFPTLYARQTMEGTIMLGGSNEMVDLDDGTTSEVLARIAQQAVKTFPILENTRLVRAWGALRIMTPDSLPLYQQSEEFPGAFLMTCHSGITLAAFHAAIMADAVADGVIPNEYSCFSGERFNA